MKIKNIKLTLWSFIVLLCFSTCTLESDSKAAGDLAGMWHCVYIDKGAASVELKDQKVYWSFQGNLLLLEDKAGNHSRILYRFKKNGNTLELREPYRYDAIYEAVSAAYDDPRPSLVYLLAKGDEPFNIIGGKHVPWMTDAAAFKAAVRAKLDERAGRTARR